MSQLSTFVSKLNTGVRIKTKTLFSPCTQRTSYRRSDEIRRYQKHVTDV